MAQTNYTVAVVELILREVAKRSVGNTRINKTDVYEIAKLIPNGSFGGLNNFLARVKRRLSGCGVLSESGKHNSVYGVIERAHYKMSSTPLPVMQFNNTNGTTGHKKNKNNNSFPTSNGDHDFTSLVCDKPSTAAKSLFPEPPVAPESPVHVLPNVPQPKNKGKLTIRSVLKFLLRCFDTIIGVSR